MKSIGSCRNLVFCLISDTITVTKQRKETPQHDASDLHRNIRTAQPVLHSHVAEIQIAICIRIFRLITTKIIKKQQLHFVTQDGTAIPIVWLVSSAGFHPRIYSKHARCCLVPTWTRKKNKNKKNWKKWHSLPIWKTTPILITSLFTKRRCKICHPFYPNKSKSNNW